MLEISFSSCSQNRNYVKVKKFEEKQDISFSTFKRIQINFIPHKIPIFMSIRNSCYQTNGVGIVSKFMCFLKIKK